MSSPFERAHIRLLESRALPVRTHERRAVIEPKLGQGRRFFTAHQKELLLDGVKAMVEGGHGVDDIAHALGVSKMTVRRRMLRLGLLVVGPHGGRRRRRK